MAVIHNTTIKPTKTELLTPWLPTRAWYLGGADQPELVKAGGFRLDDPEGEVGIEFIVVTDRATASAASYLVPLSYRGAPLEGAEHALVGTMEHGVLGTRWIYDGAHDPVVVAQLLALIEGQVVAQSQSVSHALDQDVTSAYVEGTETDFDFTGAAAIDDQDGTELTAESGATLRLHRVLRPLPTDAPALRSGAAGQVTGVWEAADGTRTRGLIAELRE
ncbi:maltokinase N-terminal cap-like domain-containing protein [Actinospica robiniae]|uniref:maltokinase N-terminal cap-like domain-containing protein n=1 Tax=Actinospica robiniae TaxID=304901 RepID=UPI00041F9047|nr:hypothetical protein [Actinospica robiniae]